jgi:hypothetical protein
MRMPGYTAEASLYQTSVRHRSTLAWSTNGERVAPQMQSVATCIIDSVVGLGNCLQGGFANEICQIFFNNDLRICRDYF